MKAINECTIDELRDAGYAVVIFTPEELEGADPSTVEDNLVSTGWDIISIHAESEDSKEDSEEKSE